MKIQVLGSGCPTCKKLHEIVQMAVTQLELIDRVEYLTGEKGIQMIMEMGIMQSPVLAIDGKPVMTSFTSDVEKIKEVIQKAKEK